MKLLLLLDYDGTLTPIVSKPSLALLKKEQRNILKKLSKDPAVILGIISGRALADVKKKVGLNNIFYAGNHGFEIQAGKKKFIHPQALKTIPAVQKIASLLKRRTKNIKGVVIEDKKLSLSMHYRLVRPKNVVELKRVFNAVLKPFIVKRVVRVTAGKKVLEVRPNIAWDKGKAVLWAIEKLGSRNVYPVFIGDDRTDEDAFKVLKRKGVSFRVGAGRKTLADHCFSDVKSVYSFLHDVIQSF